MKKIRCARCRAVFQIRRDGTALPAGEPQVDATYVSRHDSAPPQPEASPAAQTVSPEPGEASAGPLQLPPRKRLSLAILAGPDAGSVFRIQKPVVTIGRADADLTLNDSEASRNHAAVEVRELEFTLCDLGSTNGTMMAGAPIDGRAPLTDKSEFQVGGTTLMLIVTEE